MLDIHIKLDREEVVDCVSSPGDGEFRPVGYSSVKLQSILKGWDFSGGFTLEEVLRVVRVYLMELEVPLGKYQITLTQNFGGSRKTLTYESGRT